MRSDRLLSEHPEFVGRSPIRWLLLALTVTAALMPTPSLLVWGQYSMLLLAGLSLLLIESIAFGRARIYSPPVQWVWLILAGILAAHSLVDQYDAHLHWSGGSVLQGEVNNSAWFQLGLIWLGVMLFRQVSRKPLGVSLVMDAPLLVLSLSGAIVATIQPRSMGVHPAWLLSMATSTLWIAGTWVNWPAKRWATTQERMIAYLRLGVAAVPVGLCLTQLDLTLAVLVLAALLPSLSVWWMARRGCSSRVWIAVSAAWTLLAVGVGCAIWGQGMAWSWMGRGERGLVDASALDWGGRALLSWTGVVGLAVSVAVPFWTAAMVSRKDRPAWWPAVICGGLIFGMSSWMSATGWVNPLVTVGLMVLWGRTSMELAPRFRDRSIGGARLAAILVLTIVMLVIAAKAGLVSHLRVTESVGDKTLHGVLGFILTLALAWWGSTRSWVWGLVGLGVGAAAGVCVEHIQQFATHVLSASARRAFETADMASHAYGALAAAGCWAEAMLIRALRQRGLLSKRPLRVAYWVGLAAIGLGWAYTLVGACDRIYLQPTPWVCVSDMICTHMPKEKKGKPEPLYIPGMGEIPNAGDRFYTASSRLDQIRWCHVPARLYGPKKRSRVLPGIRDAAPGLDIRPVLTFPYNRLGTTEIVCRVLQQNVEQTFCVVDTRDIPNPASPEADLWDKQFAERTQQGPTALGFCKNADELNGVKPGLHRRFPDTPVVCAPEKHPSPGGLAEWMQRYLTDPGGRRARIRVVSSDLAFLNAFRVKFKNQCDLFTSLAEERRDAAKPSKE